MRSFSSFDQPINQELINDKFKVAFQLFLQSMTTQSNTNVMIHLNPNKGMAVTRVRDFYRMNPPKFHGSKVKEDP